MAQKNGEEQTRIIELLEKMFVFQLFALGLKQERIAKTVGKNTAWVNALVKGMSKGGKSDGN